MKEQEIVIGEGIKPILLGMSFSQIEKVIGKPDEVDDLDYDDGESVITWFYHDLDLDLSFESDEDFKLTYISFYSDIYILGGAIKVGMLKDEVLKLCEKLNYKHGGVDLVYFEDSLQKNESLNIDDQNITFWFANGELEEIQIGPLW